MKINSTLFYLEVKNFLRGKIVLWGIFGLIFFGLYSFYHGKSVIGRQKETIGSISRVQKNHLQHIQQEGKGKSAGTTAYYPFFYTFNNPSSWAAFSIGQRDVNTFSLKVKILGIEGHLYDSELTNPLSLLVGNLDASFVFIFLFPLLIIAFCYNSISHEQENGVWKIVRTSSRQTSTVIFSKLLVRFVLIIATSLIIFLISAVYLNLPLSIPTFQIGAVLITYHVFWFLLSVLVISFGKSSSFNATILISIWIFLCILFPGISNLLISEQIPVPEALETTVKQREGYHQKWDLPKKPTMETFYAAYPAYRKYPIPEDKYSSGWYYAMQYAGDVESTQSSASLFTKLNQRQSMAETISLFDPVILSQQLLNRIANTDINNHIDYLQSVKRYHKLLREFFYPYIFEETLTENVAWHAYPKYQPEAYQASPAFAGIAAIMTWSAVLLMVSIGLFKRNFIIKTSAQNA